MPTMTPMREETITGRAMRLYSAFVIFPSSCIFAVSSFKESRRFSAFARISTRANRPIRHTARSMPR